MKRRRLANILAVLAVSFTTLFSAASLAHAQDSPDARFSIGEAPLEDAGTAGYDEFIPDGEGSTAPNVSTPSQSEIRAYYKDHKIDLDSKLEYASGKTPDISNYSDAGVLSDKCLNEALDVMNFIRYIAGIPSDVALDENYTYLAQAAAFVNHANGTLSHFPKNAGSKPAGMPQELWDAGATGASSSNIAWGSWNGYSLAEQICNGYMDDGDEYNIDCVGHRRWILNPSMGKTGFGSVDGGGKGTYGALYAFDHSGSSDCSGVVWPAQNMPCELFNVNYPWSISMGKSLNASQISVTLTRTGDGKSWHFASGSTDGDFYVNNDGYGMSGCIIFRPKGLGSISASDSFAVEVKNGGETLISYNVDFFELEGEEPEIPQMEASVGKVDLNVAVVAGTYNADDYKITVTVSNKGKSPISDYAVSLVSGAEYFVLGGTTSGTLPGKDSKSFTICPAGGLEGSTYEGKLQISAKDAEPIEIPLTMVLTRSWRFNVSITNGDLGTVDLNGPATAAEGSSREVAITPKKGCRISELVVDEVEIELTDEEKLTGITYTFSDIKKDHSIAVAFEYTEAPPQDPVSIGKAKIEQKPAAKTYTGAEITADDLILSYNGKQLAEGTDYTLTYTKNVKAGTATALVQGINGFTGSRKIRFRIVKKALDASMVASFEAECVYLKGGVKPSVSLTYNGVQLQEGTDYRLSYKNNKKAYTDASFVTAKAPSVKVIGKGNFSASFTLNFTIAKQSADRLTFTGKDKVVKAKKGGFVSSFTICDVNGKKLKAGTDYDKKSIVYLDEAGEVIDPKAIIDHPAVITVRVTCIGNYEGTVTGSYRLIEK